MPGKGTKETQNVKEN